MQKLDRNTEFETKYNFDISKQYKFKDLMEKIGYKSFLYVEGDDDYFTKPDGSFLRYRRATTEKRAEITIKVKPNLAVNNIKREEINWRVDGNSEELIRRGVELMGYKYNFKITKYCHIYRLDDNTTIVFYTVRDEKKDLHHFLEIELDEKTIHNYTFDEAMDKIRYYEQYLKEIGITHKNRLNKSLIEMFGNEL